MAKVEQITEPMTLGEGPHWDHRAQVLYYVSILDHTIHKYTPASGEHTRTKLDGTVGFIIPVDGSADQFVVGLGRKVLIIRWDGKDGSKATVVKEIADLDKGTKNRLNDAKADPRGRLYAGTMGYEEPLGNIEPNKGSLYRVTPSSVEQLDTNISISNGLAWDEASKSFYFIDSSERKIRRYDWDPESGAISKQSYIFDFVKQNVEGSPDGMTIDTDGNLWVAVFEGSAVIKVDPRTGNLLQKIEIPTSQVTSVTFGGPNLDVLYVTTASLSINYQRTPPAGACYKVTGLGVKGHPNVNFKL